MGGDGGPGQGDDRPVLVDTTLDSKSVGTLPHIPTLLLCSKGGAGSQGGRLSLDVGCWALHVSTDPDAHRVGRGFATHTHAYTHT